jgi:hypothetical protein
MSFGFENPVCHPVAGLQADASCRAGGNFQNGGNRHAG